MPGSRLGHLRIWLGLLFAGATALGTWFLLGPSLGPDARLGYYRPVHGVFTFGYDRAVLVLFVPFALALLAWRRGARIRLAWLVGGAVFLHLLLLFPPLPQSQDLYQYLFYGRMQAVYHANPYLVHPSALWHDAWYPWVRWPSQTTVYGPVWTLLSFGVAKLAGSSHTLAYLYLKVVVLAMDLAVMRLVVTVAREHGGEEAAGFGLLAYAWNPLILITVPLGGLADVALAAGILGAMLARRRGRPGLATVLLALSSLVKIYAVPALLLHLILLGRERGWRPVARHAAGSAALAAIAFAPYWAGASTFAGLVHVATLSNRSLAGVVQRLLTPLLSALGSSGASGAAGAVVRWFGAEALVIAFVVAVRKVRAERDLWPAVLAILAIYVLVTPRFLYWYLVAPVAMAAAMPRNRLTDPVLTASGTILIAVHLPLKLLGQALEALARYGPPVALWARRKPRRTDGPPEPGLADTRADEPATRGTAVTPGR